MFKTRQFVHDNEFEFRIIKMLNFQNWYYIEFFHMFNALQSRMSIENKLIINFNFKRQSKNEHWSTMIIEIIMCIFRKRLCFNATICQSWNEYAFWIEREFFFVQHDKHKRCFLSYSNSFSLYDWSAIWSICTWCWLRISVSFIEMKSQMI